jgi:HPt (histidine-containing phosphotransfer) domain-containing protein
LYAEVRAGSRRPGPGPAVMVVDLTTVALAALVLVLVAYLRAGGPAAGRDPAPGTATGEQSGSQPAVGGGCPVALPTRDLDDALRITGGSRAIADALLEQMLAELPAQIDAVTAAATAGDWGEAREAAKGIRGAAAACAVPALHAAACRLQTAAATAESGAVAAALTEVEHERHRLISQAPSPPPSSTLARASVP